MNINNLSGFDNLPIELLYYVWFYLLSLKSKKSFALINKKCNDIFRHHMIPKLDRHIFYRKNINRVNLPIFFDIYRVIDYKNGSKYIEFKCFRNGYFKKKLKCTKEGTVYCDIFDQKKYGKKDEYISFNRVYMIERNMMNKVDKRKCDICKKLMYCKYDTVYRCEMEGCYYKMNFKSDDININKKNDTIKELFNINLHVHKLCKVCRNKKDVNVLNLKNENM